MGHSASLASCGLVYYHIRSHAIWAFSVLLNFFFSAQGDYYQLTSIPVLAPECSSSFYCDAAFPLG